jgi:hypothetical protein
VGFATVNPVEMKSFLFWNPAAHGALSRRARGPNMSHEAGFDYERSDIRGRDIAWLAAGLALFVIVTPLAMPFVFPQSMQYRTPSAPPALSADAPQLGITPREDLRRFERSEAQFEQSYGWTDRSKGAVRIPIDRAMQLLAERGLPGWPMP